MSALTSSASFKRGRSRSRGSTRSRTMASVSRSRSARSITTNLTRTWPMPQGWNNKLADPFPTKQTAIFRYSANIAIDASSITATSHVFRTNSIFDPDWTGTGHQPYGHDQYAAIYKHYRVTSSTLTATSASQGSNNVLGVTLRSSSTAITDPENIREVKGTRFVALSASLDSRSVAMSSNLNNAIVTENQQSLFGSDPIEQDFFHVWIAPNGAAEPTNQAILIDIVYYVEMWEPIILGSS